MSEETNAEPVVQEETKPHPDFDKVLSQAIERKKIIGDKDREIEALKLEIKNLKQPSDEPPIEQPDVKISIEDIDIETITKNIMEQLEVKQKAESSREASLKTLLSNHSLPDSMLSILKDSNNPEETAKQLGQSFKIFQSPDSAETGSMSSLDSVLNNINKKLGLDNTDGNNTSILNS